MGVLSVFFVFVASFIAICNNLSTFASFLGLPGTPRIFFSFATILFILFLNNFFLKNGLSIWPSTDHFLIDAKPSSKMDRPLSSCSSVMTRGGINRKTLPKIPHTRTIKPLLTQNFANALASSTAGSLVC